MKCGIRLCVILLVLLMSLAGCGKSREGSYSGAPPVPAVSLTQADEGGGVPGDEALSKSAETSKSASDSSGLPTRRMIIYTVNMSIVAKDFDASAKIITAMVDESSGYIVSSQINRSDDSGGRYGTITMKIPAESLTSFTDKISQIGEVTNMTKNGQDVTEQWVDISARLQNMKIEEKHYQDMYDRAKNVDEMLKVRNELGRVRGDIEALEGKLNYLKTNTSMATIVLSITQKGLSTPKSFWNFGGTVSDAVTVLKFLVKMVIALAIYGVIVFIPLGFLIYCIKRVLRLIRKPGLSERSAEKKRGQPAAGREQIQGQAAHNAADDEKSNS